MQFDPSQLSMTQIIRLQTLLSQELTRRFEASAGLAFSDIAGSTEYFSRFGDEAGRQMQQLHIDLLAACVPAHGGRIVDTAGDGAFSAFPTAMAVAEAMADLQHRVTEANEHRQRDHQLIVRIGAHWGRVLTDGVQVTGDAVNFCARVAGSAEPGQIRLSRELFQELPMAQRLVCRPLGAVTLKGVQRPADLLLLQWRDHARFPTAVHILETGQKLPLPPQDIVSFGRLELVEGMSAIDVVLALNDSAATRQISRWHFELRRHPSGYTLRAVSTQATVVDGVRAVQGEDVPIRPGTTVMLAGVMTLLFYSPELAAPGHADDTMHVSHLP